MIVVTVGTIPFQFDRVIRWLEMLLEEGTISEEVFIQYGVSNISHIKKYPLISVAPELDRERFSYLVENSRFVISHAGQGSTRWLSARKASFVIVPRLAQYREHIDDHQLSFAKSIEDMGVQCCLSLKELRNFVLNPPARSQGDFLSDPKLVDHLLKIYPTTPTPNESDKFTILSKGY